MDPLKGVVRCPTIPEPASFESWYEIPSEPVDRFFWPHWQIPSVRIWPWPLRWVLGRGSFRAGAHGRVDRVRTRPTFSLFFLFFFKCLSCEANGFARGLKLNEIEHYNLDESKGHCPRETFFVSRFSPAFPHARRRHPSLRYNFSRHLLSIFHVIYILSTYKTHSGPHSCACYFTAAVSPLNCWHENARTLEILWKVTWFFVDFHRNMSVFAKLSRTLGYLPFPSLRSSFIRTDLLSFQTREQGRDAGLQIQSFDFLDLGVANERRRGRRLQLTWTGAWWRKRTGVVSIRYFFRVTILLGKLRFPPSNNQV